VVAEASDGGEAVMLADRLRPDIVLMDVSMPKGAGVEATRVIRARLPDMHAEPAVIGKAVRAGAGLPGEGLHH